MTEKPEPLKPVRPPRTAEERKHWGEMREPVFKDTLGKQLGNKLASIFTFWMR